MTDYNFTCLPNNLLIQTFESDGREVNGRVFIYVNGCTKPKADWKLMPNDGYLYWSVNLVKGSGYYQTARIHDVVVTERLRGQGLGTTLVKVAEQRMRKFGAKAVGGTASKDGMEFWPKLGYSITGRTLFKSLEGLEYWNTVPELKQTCRDRGLSDEGGKEDLIRRLRQSA